VIKFISKDELKNEKHSDYQNFKEPRYAMLFMLNTP